MHFYKAAMAPGYSMFLFAIILNGVIGQSPDFCKTYHPDPGKPLYTFVDMLTFHGRYFNNTNTSVHSKYVCLHDQLKPQPGKPHMDLWNVTWPGQLPSDTIIPLTEHQQFCHFSDLDPIEIYTQMEYKTIQTFLRDNIDHCKRSYGNGSELINCHLVTSIYYKNNMLGASHTGNTEIFGGWINRGLNFTKDVDTFRNAFLIWDSRQPEDLTGNSEDPNEKRAVVLQMKPDLTDPTFRKPSPVSAGNEKSHYLVAYQLHKDTQLDLVKDRYLPCCQYRKAMKGNYSTCLASSVEDVYWQELKANLSVNGTEELRIYSQELKRVVPIEASLGHVWAMTAEPVPVDTWRNNYVFGGQIMAGAQELCGRFSMTKDGPDAGKWVLLTESDLLFKKLVAKNEQLDAFDYIYRHLHANDFYGGAAFYAQDTRSAGSRFTQHLSDYEPGHNYFYVSNGTTYTTNDVQFDPASGLVGGFKGTALFGLCWFQLPRHCRHNDTNHCSG